MRLLEIQNKIVELKSEIFRIKIRINCNFGRPPSFNMNQITISDLINKRLRLKQQICKLIKKEKLLTERKEKLNKIFNK